MQHETDHDGRTRDHIHSLEEDIRCEENLLKYLLDRQTRIKEELEETRLRRQRLLEREILIRERTLHLRATRIKNTSLREELQESLIKSRERLARLTSLEQEERYAIEDGSLKDDMKVMDKEDSNDMERNDLSLQNTASEDTTDSKSLEMPNSNLLSTSLVNVHSIEIFKEFHGAKYPISRLKYFLPAVGSDWMEKILTLSTREANGLDWRPDGTRRPLLWNTCLDFSELCRTTMIAGEKDISNDSYESDNLVDPQVPLCPYELSGVCADDMCPYQHTEKETLPRERLPLPPLALGYATDKDKRERKQRKQKTPDESSESEQEPDIDVLDETNSESPDAFVGNYVALPAINTCNDSDSEGSRDAKEDHETTDVNDDDNLLSQRFLEQRYELSKHSFWWGGDLNGKYNSIEDFLRGAGGITIDKATVLVQPPESLDRPRFLGRIIDMSRLAIHAGRYDVGLALCRVFTDDSAGYLKTDGFCKASAEQLARLVKPSCMFQPSRMSPFLSAFATQASMAVLSVNVEQLYRDMEMKDEKLYSEASLHNVAMKSCGMLLNLDSPEAGPFGDFVAEFKKALVGSVANSWEENKGKDVLRKYQDMHDCLRRVYMILHASSVEFPTLSRVDNDIIQPCWSITKRWIEALTDEDRPWDGLKAVVLMGSVILASLQSFAACVQEDHLTTSLTPALATVDKTIHQILSTLSHHLADIPLMELVLAPLFAASVATASFLRLYSTAQHRLENILSLNPKLRDNKKERSHAFAFSEVLWSQLFQLRMTLPLEPVSLERPEHLRQLDTSPERRRDHTLLLKRMSETGIHLYHISLEGDWILAQSVPNVQAQCDTLQGKSLRETSTDIALWLFEENDGTEKPLQELRILHLPLSSYPDCRTQNPYISRMPRSIMLVGHRLKTLHLVGCQFDLLPVSFALYFPNLINLDLSQNQLEEIPSSLGSLLHLESLCLSWNRMKRLQEDTLGTSLKFLILSYNRLEQIPHTALYRRCFQLEELVISHNCLNLSKLIHVAVPQLALNLRHLRTLEFQPQEVPEENSSANTPLWLSFYDAGRLSLLGLSAPGRIAGKDLVLTCEDVDRTSWEPEKPNLQPYAVSKNNGVNIAER